MPQVVDHEVRRREVAEVAYQLIATSGTEAASVRAVADAAGFSTTVVSHYFASKHALLEATYDLSASYARDLVNKAAASRDAQTHLNAYLPIHPRQKTNWRLWFAYLNASLSEPDFTKRQKEMVRTARDDVKAFWQKIEFAPARLPSNELDLLARQTFAFLFGIALQATFDPRDWPASRQRAQTEHHLAMLEDRFRSFR